MVSTTLRRPFEFIANHIVLDFTNTVNARPTFTRDDLGRPEDVAEWVVAARSVDPRVPQTRQVVGMADLADLAEAVALREGLYRVFGPIAAGNDPDASALSFLTRRAADAIRSGLWIRGGSVYGLTWEPESFATVAHWMADEAVQLLRSPGARRIGACDGCGWLFLDTSRAHGRRWCSMNMCGARHKMRRYHQRQAQATSTA
jgi:predicted RNA-binding Zn ribbon-like protein